MLGGSAEGSFGGSMVMSYLILAVSAGLLFFYLQTACQKILRRQFEEEYFQSIVKANRLAFAEIRVALDKGRRPFEYSRLHTALRCDFLTLAYMLKNAANPRQHFSGEERLLMAYFRCLMLALSVRHWFRLQERATVLKLAKVLEYFANVVGQRVSGVRFGNLSATDYLQSL
jgi:hypothetical protein